MGISFLDMIQKGVNINIKELLDFTKKKNSVYKTMFFFLFSSFMIYSKVYKKLSKHWFSLGFIRCYNDYAVEQENGCLISMAGSVIGVASTYSIRARAKEDLGRNYWEGTCSIQPERAAYIYEDIGRCIRSL